MKNALTINNRFKNKAMLKNDIGVNAGVIRNLLLNNGVSVSATFFINRYD